MNRFLPVVDNHLEIIPAPSCSDIEFKQNNYQPLFIFKFINESETEPLSLSVCVSISVGVQLVTLNLPFPLFLRGSGHKLS